MLRVDTIEPGNGAMVGSGPVQDFIYAPQQQQKQSYPQVGLANVSHVRLKICVGCRRTLTDRDFADAVRDTLENFRQLLAAAITAKALETEKPRL